MYIVIGLRDLCIKFGLFSKIGFFFVIVERRKKVTLSYLTLDAPLGDFICLAYANTIYKEIFFVAFSY